MQIAFSIDGQAATFERSDVTGRAELHFGEQIVVLQSPLKPTAHFGIRKRTAWRTRIGAHDVEIVKNRPRLFGGLRANSFSVVVDGVAVAEATGK
jgi:hypothetical protein